ncbi:MAG: mannonate dehydratase [Clostridia bacterium]
MRVGMGIGGANRADKNYIQYLAQIGAPNAILALPDKEILPSADKAPWSLEELSSLKKFYNENGVNIEGFENIHPIYFAKILLDMPGKEEQMEYIKRSISNMGKAGIKIFGYNFSLAGVTARYTGPFARGGADTVRFSLDKAPIDGHIPLGTVFKRVFDPNAPEGNLPPVSLEEMIERRDWFLSQILPVAEEAGVKMAAHPEDPPIPVMQSTARILIRPENFDHLFTKFDSPSNCIEFCQGTFAEIPNLDVYDTIKHFAKQDKIAYVHFRNVVGTLPEYTEVFIDEGDIDMVKSLQIYKECGYNGMLMPDHSPDVSIGSPREVGMAYAVGYIRGIMKSLDIEIED